MKVKSVPASAINQEKKKVFVLHSGSLAINEPEWNYSS